MRKMLLKMLVGTILSLLLIGCGELAEQPAAPAPAVEPAAPLAEEAPAEQRAVELQIEGTPLIILRRTGGFAGLEDEWWLFGDGRIVNRSDNQIQQVDGAEVVALHQDMLNGGFFNLAPEYMPADSGADRFTYEITLIDGDNRHTVATMDDTDTIPDLLRESLHRITMLLVSQRE
jgi:hypothetical protein